MNNYSIMTVATVTTEYRIKANNKKEAEEKFYSGEWYQSDDLDRDKYHPYDRNNLVRYYKLLNKRKKGL